MATYKVPYGLDVSVTIRREGDSAFVDVHAPMYLNKEWTMSHSYSSSEFTDYEILRDRDFVTTLIDHYL
ncbi:MAG: hypothetical protein ABTQ25_02480 [Nitrosomonas ureae]